MACRWQTRSLSTGSSAWSRIQRNAMKWFLVSIASSMLTRSVPSVVNVPVLKIWAVCFGVRVDPSMWLEFHANCSWVST